MLPLDPQRLVDSLAEAVDCVLIDRLNYSGRLRYLYKKHRLEHYLNEAYFEETAKTVEDLGKIRDMKVEAVF